MPTGHHSNLPPPRTVAAGTRSRGSGERPCQRHVPPTSPRKSPQPRPDRHRFHERCETRSQHGLPPTSPNIPPDGRTHHLTPLSSGRPTVGRGRVPAQQGDVTMNVTASTRRDVTTGPDRECPALSGLRPPTSPQSRLTGTSRTRASAGLSASAPWDLTDVAVFGGARGLLVVAGGWRLLTWWLPDPPRLSTMRTRGIFFVRVS